MRTAHLSPDLAKLTTAEPRRGGGGHSPGARSGMGGEVAIRRSSDPFAWQLVVPVMCLMIIVVGYIG